MLTPAAVRPHAAATAAALLIALALAAPARAQSAAATPAPGILTRSAFTFSWVGLASSDPRFSWDAHLGADLDLADYRVGRLNFVADYEAVLGSERREFDLNHGNYVLDATFSYRLRRVEIAGGMRHESRHLNDRDNPDIVAWNVLEARASRRFAVGRSTLDARLEIGRVLQHTFVDYVWTSDLQLALRRTLSERLSVFGTAAGGLVGVDRTKLGRNRQCGAQLEGGIRLAGGTAAVEVFAGYERRIDGYPLERTRVRFFSFGFRIASR